MITKTQVLPRSPLLPSQVETFAEKKVRPLFYDIETTGLSGGSSFVYLIGAVIPRGEDWELTQWMAMEEEEERQILEAFSLALSGCDFTIQYNGDSFDMPFLETRYDHYGLPSPFEDLPSLDLYRTLKPLKPLLKLENMKQPSLETLLSCPKRIYPDGKDCIRLYDIHEDKKNDPSTIILFGHNQEDLLGLLQVFTMTAYLALLHGKYQVAQSEWKEETLCLTLQVPSPLPVPFVNESPAFSIAGEESQVRLLIPLKDGRLRRYYDNYRDYVYLFQEDTAIPKALATYMDRSLYKPAKPETCFTWFPVSERFLEDRTGLVSYLKTALPIFLSTLS
ncbi:MAG: ribonuclease H-like domain-containing protein [Eubacteriales bacterium]|nr:ribonuclease H-like domain-containing protein [Eubacteriales bacterium]